MYVLLFTFCAQKSEKMLLFCGLEIVPLPGKFPGDAHERDEAIFRLLVHFDDL